MFFPEFLFQLSGRDQQVTWLDPFIRRAESAVAAVQVEATLEVPDGLVLILQAASVVAVGGGAQVVQSMELGLRPVGVAAGNQIDVSNAAIAALAGNSASIPWSGSVVVPPGWTVVGLGNFSAGAVANTIILMVTGILIPTGNIQRV